MSPKPRQYLSTEEMEKRLAEIQSLRKNVESQIQINAEEHKKMYQRIQEQLEGQRDEIIRLQKEIEMLREKIQNNNENAKSFFYSE